MVGKIEFPEDSKNRAGAVKWSKNGNDFVIPVANGGYVKDLFSGNSSLTKSYEQPMNGFSIFHGGPAGSADITFKIGAITGMVNAQQSYDGVFEPYTQVAITSSQPFQAEVRGYEAISIEIPLPEDTTPPSNVSSLTATNITQSSVTLNWAAATDNVGVAGYDIYRNGSLISSVVGTTYNATGLAAATEYLFMVQARDEANNVSSGISVPVTTSEGTPGGDTTPPVVTASPASGTYSSAQNVTLTANEEATIYYTTNGIDPTESDTPYSSPISVSTTTTIKARAKDTAGNWSTVHTALYTIDAGSTGSPVDDASRLLFMDNQANNTTIPNPDNYFIGTTPFTLSVTFKPALNGANAANDLVSRYEPSVQNNSVMKLSFGWNNKITANLFGQKADGITNFLPLLTSPAEYTDYNVYYHITIVRDATKFSLYINDVLSHSVAVLTTDVVNQVSTMPLVIGESGKTGLFKNVSYYNRALTPGELTQNYNALK